MTSFAKHIAVIAAALIATTALGEKSDDDKPAKTEDKSSKDGKDKDKDKTDSKDGKDSGKKKKKDKDKKGDPDAPKKIDVPVIKDHPSYGLSIPYFDGTGKRQMNFKIGVATRLDDTHVEMKDMTIETFNAEGEHEMQIDLPISVFDTDKSAVTTQTHVTIARNDFTLSGESMIFYTRTKQGGLAGNVHMLIYNMKEEATGDKSEEERAKDTKPDPTASPDTFKTPQGRRQDLPSTPTEKQDKFLTPSAKQ